MYVILEGEIEILKSTSGSSNKTLVNLKKGDFFGEMALIEDKARSASAVCKKDASLLVMNNQILDSVIETNPDFDTYHVN